MTFASACQYLKDAKCFWPDSGEKSEAGAALDHPAEASGQAEADLQSRDASLHKLTIVLPACNQADAIGEVLEACLAAAPMVQEQAGLSGLEVLVVDDGSTDQTRAIAQSFDEVKVVSHGRSRGYGAALKTGFRHATGDLVAFLDADATCLPSEVGRLCMVLIERDADMVCGSRLASENRMPWFRRLANGIFAFFLNAVSDSGFTDIATGTRVLKKTALDRLYPLPDGSHFAPAMSCRAALGGEVRVAEVPIPYGERRGGSRLRVIVDGVRFLRAVFDAALCYRPRRILGALGLALIMLAMGYSIYPAEYYLHHGTVPSSVIGRATAILVIGIAGLNLLTLGIISDRIALLSRGWPRMRGFLDVVVERVFSDAKLIIAGLLLILLAGLLNIRTIVEYVTTGHATAHWSSFVVGGALILAGFQAISLGLLQRMVSILRQDLEARDGNQLQTG